MYDVPGQPPIDSFSAATDAVVVGGPRDVNDGTWYQVLFPPHDEVMRLAWVRVADLTDIAPIDGLCPTSPDALIGLLPWDRLRCFSETPVTVTGEVGHCQGGVVEGEPEWLAYACWEVTAGEGGPLGLHAAPESGIVFPEHRVRARITGHFDDPASPTCRPRHDALNPAWEAPSPGEQVYLCREAFVVDTFEILEDLGPQEG